MVRYTSQIPVRSLDGAICDRAGPVAMYAVVKDKRRTAYTVTVDAQSGVELAFRRRSGYHHAVAGPIRPINGRRFHRPGHMVPLQAKSGEVLRRPGHTGPYWTWRMAGLQPAGRFAASAKDEARWRTDELQVFTADEHGLALITIADLIEWRRKHEAH